MRQEHRSLVALCDCNNFFVSCERLFRPELRNRPIVVLSSNDGCIVSRSNEVKAMGIPMGEAYFKVKSLLERKGAVVFSGNLAFYGEISGRIMRILSGFTDSLEIYSIDEAFLKLPPGANADPCGLATEIRATIGRWAGIPVSIGIAGTKTLAKLASEHAKRAEGGVFCMPDGEASHRFLESTPIKHVWGIGFRSARLMERYGVRTASDLIRRDVEWVRRKLSIRGVMTMLELKGYPCIELENRCKAPQSIQVSRSFGEQLHSLDDLKKPVVEDTLGAASRLPRQDWPRTPCPCISVPDISVGTMSGMRRAAPISKRPSGATSNLSVPPWTFSAAYIDPASVIRKRGFPWPV